MVGGVGGRFEKGYFSDIDASGFFSWMVYWSRSRYSWAHAWLRHGVRWPRVALLAGACLVLAKAASAQDGLSTLYRLHAGNGLPHNTVYDIHFDCDGWLWAATSVGLFRHDGVAFVPYRSALARHLETHDIQEGPGGEIYVQNFRQQIFRVRADSLQLVLDCGSGSGELSTYSLMADGVATLVGRQLTFATYGQLPAIDAKTSPARIIASEPAVSAKTLLPGGRDIALINDPRGLPSATFDGQVMQSLRADRAGKPMFSAILEADVYILRDARDTLRWQRMQIDGFETIWSDPTPNPGQRFRAYAKTPNGLDYFGGTDGVYTRSVDGSWTKVLPKADVSALAVDRQGRLWGATLDQGVFALPTHRAARIAYPEIPNSITTLGVLSSGERFGATRNGQVYSLTDSGSRLLLTDRSIVALWRGEGDSLRFGRRHSIGAGGRLRLLNPNTVGVINQLKHGLVVASGLEVYAGISGLFVQVPAPEREDFGAAQWVDSTGTLRRLRTGRTYDLAYDALHHTLWVAALDSLLLYDREGGFARRGTTAALPVANPTTVDVLAPGEVLVGSSGHGLLYSSQASATAPPTFERVGDVQGSQVQAVETANGVAWVVTEAGLHRCRRVDALPGEPPLRCETIGVDHGLPKLVPNAITLSGKRVFISYHTDVYELDADTQAGVPQSLPQTVVERVEVAGVILDHEGLNWLRIAAGADALSLQPRAPVYGTGATPSFRYRIESLDHDWHTVAGSRPEIFFPGLPAGTHLIEIAVDAEGMPVTKVGVYAARVWWRHPLALPTLLAILAGGIGYALYRRARRRSHDLRIQADLRRATLSAIAAQMNPHFMFNALNSIQEFVLDQDPVKANTYLSRFARLMRLTLEHSRAELVPLKDEIEAMRLYTDLEGLRLDGRVLVGFDVDPSLPQQALLPPLLVQPYIENAFKHGFSDSDTERLDVSYHSTTDGRLLVEVRDSGIGREASSRRSTKRRNRSFGMGATAQRVGLLCESRPGSVDIEVVDLYKDSGAAAGTLVRLHISLEPAPAGAFAKTQPIAA